MMILIVAVMINCIKELLKGSRAECFHFGVKAMGGDVNF